MTHFINLPIVVVEDDIDMLSLIGALLRARYPHEIVLFEDSRKALNFLGESEFAVVVLDLTLPEISGLDLLRFIFSQKPRIPTVIVTGDQQLETAVECMKLGAVDFLMKPIHVERLVASIDTALKLYKKCKEPPLQPGDGLDSPAESSLIPEGVPERLINAARYMEEQRLSHDLYLETVAKEACLSKYHFTREFKKYFGISPIQFMLKLRIKHACSLLMSREAPISRVANECGFNDQSEFTKWFKKFTGVTPSSFRKSRGFRAKTE